MSFARESTMIISNQSRPLVDADLDPKSIKKNNDTTSQPVEQVTIQSLNKVLVTFDQMPKEAGVNDYVIFANQSKLVYLGLFGQQTIDYSDKKNKIMGLDRVLQTIKDNQPTEEQNTNLYRIISTHHRTRNTVTGFLKSFDSTVSENTRTIRLLNEAIIGMAVELVNNKLGNRFLTPAYKLVIDDNKKITRLFTKTVSYSAFGDKVTNKDKLMQAIMLGLGHITAIRALLEDPDASGNVGFSNDNKQLTTIDYGLANFLYLSSKNALLPAERDRITPARAGEIFSVNKENFISGPVRMQQEDDVGFFAHCGFSDFEEDIVKIQEENPALVADFLEQIYDTSLSVIDILTQADFKKLICAKLGTDFLSVEDQKIADEIIDTLILKGQNLSPIAKEVNDLPDTDHVKCFINSPISAQYSPHLRRKNSSASSLNNNVDYDYPSSTPSSSPPFSLVRASSDDFANTGATLLSLSIFSGTPASGTRPQSIENSDAKQEHKTGPHSK